MYSEKYLTFLQNYQRVHFLNCFRLFLLKDHLKRNRALKEYLKHTWALGNSKGTQALEALYLADSIFCNHNVEKCFIVFFFFLLFTVFLFLFSVIY